MSEEIINALFKIIVVLVWVSAFVLAYISHRSEIKRLHKQNQDLLNRFMARDFQDYAYGSRIVAQPSMEVNLDDVLGYEKETKEEADRLPVD